MTKTTKTATKSALKNADANVALTAQAALRESDLQTLKRLRAVVISTPSAQPTSWVAVGYSTQTVTDKSLCTLEDAGFISVRNSKGVRQARINPEGYALLGVELPSDQTEIAAHIPALDDVKKAPKARKTTAKSAKNEEKIEMTTAKTTAKSAAKTAKTPAKTAKKVAPVEIVEEVVKPAAKKAAKPAAVKKADVKAKKAAPVTEEVDDVKTLTTAQMLKIVATFKAGMTDTEKAHALNMSRRQYHKLQHDGVLPKAEKAVKTDKPAAKTAKKAEVVELEEVKTPAKSAKKSRRTSEAVLQEMQDAAKQTKHIIAARNKEIAKAQAEVEELKKQLARELAEVRKFQSGM